MSADLARELRLGLEELAIIRAQLSTIPLSASASAGVIETAAACAMLHSFYTEIEKMLKRIAREWDRTEPSAGAWHKDLLTQMSAATTERPAVLSRQNVETLSEFLAFRHLFRGASIALMRWEKLSPLVEKTDETYRQTAAEIMAFIVYLESIGRRA